MNILIIHNFYQVRGGEDAVVENEKAMLEAMGHSVSTFFIHSNVIKEYKIADKLLMPFRIVYNEAVLKRIRKIAFQKNIDIIHVHNFWPLISPSVFFLFNRLKIPYLQTVHNYRYLTANALLYKEDITAPNNKLTIKRRKYNNFRESYLLTFIYWLTARLVRFTGVINKGSGALQVLNNFAYDVHSQKFSSNRLFIRGNFLPSKSVQHIKKQKKENYYLFLGRLSKEKGIETLINAFTKLKPNSNLQIAGKGPLFKNLLLKYKNNTTIEFLGFISGREKMTAIAKAKALIIPSEWQEVFPISLLEANFSYTPVIASNIGGLPDMIESNKTGLLFECGNEEDLKEKLKWCEDNPQRIEKMGQAARKYAEDNFSEKKSYEQLIDIYDKLISRSKKSNTILKRNDG